MSTSISRRDFVNTSISSLGAMPLSSYFTRSANVGEPLKIVCIGGHPDDPETGCGGTLAKFSKAGHQVTIIYLTKGETGIPGKGPDETAAIRSEEALSANFLPTDYIDITETQGQKRKAVFCHKSQGFVSHEYYQKDHGLMEDFRGLTVGVKAAEAFVKLARPGSLA